MRVVWGQYGDGRDDYRVPLHSRKYQDSVGILEGRPGSNDGPYFGHFVVGPLGGYRSPRSCARFDALMAEFGRNVELPEEDLMSSWTDSCNMTVADLRPETKAAVYERIR